MPDASVLRWKQKGNLYFWRFIENERNYPGWHISIDKEFAESFADLTEKMMSSEWNSQRILKVTPPTKTVLLVPNNRNGQARWRSPENLQLKNVKDFQNDLSFDIVNEGLLAILSANNLGLAKLNECLQKIMQGKNDYSIKVGETEIWFW